LLPKPCVELVYLCKAEYEKKRLDNRLSLFNNGAKMIDELYLSMSQTINVNMSERTPQSGMVPAAGNDIPNQ